MTRRTRSRWTRPGRERGSATALVVGACVLVLLIGIAAVAAGAAAQAAAQARAAADLSAVAAARTLVDGLLDDRVALRGGRRVATRNGATLHGCAIDDQVNVTVRVVVPFMTGVGWLPSGLGAEAAARAGPAP